MLTNCTFLFNIVRMRITCPHCNASYEVGQIIKNAVLVCHRCHAEFSMLDKPLGSENKTVTDQDRTLPLFEKPSDGHSGSTNSEPEHDDTTNEEIEVPAFLAGSQEYAQQIKREEMPFPEPSVLSRKETPADGALDRLSEGNIPPSNEQATGEADFSGDSDDEPLITSYLPVRNEIVIWPWMIIILLVIGSVGFWYKKDAWMDNLWFRSVLINMYLPVEVRDKDWFIIPSSVQGHWLKRDDDSQILVIQGRIENLLYSELPPPRILVRFYDDTGITESLGEKLISITEPPSMEQVKHAPFSLPEVDRIPVESQGQRGFFLVLENLPERTADFTLTPVASK